MATIHRYYLVALLALLPLPVRGQHAVQFDRNDVVAGWRSLCAGAHSGRVEWVKEWSVSRDGAPLKLRKTESATRSFNLNGSAFFYSVEEYGENPSKQNLLTIVNEKYTATLRKPKGRDGWALADSKPKGKNDDEPKERWALAWLVIGNVYLPDWIADPGFVVVRAESLAPGLVRVHFEFDKSKRKSPEVPDQIRSGSVTFDSAHSYCPVSYEFEIVTNASQQSERGTLDYDFVGEAPLLKSVSTDTIVKHAKHGLAKTSSRWTYRVHHNAGVPDEEFRLSFYDLPEPMGVTWPQPTRWWLWLSLAAVAAIVLGIGWWKVIAVIVPPSRSRPRDRATPT